MKKTKNIHNLDSLEREIYRLRLEAKKTGEKLDVNFDYLHENFDSLLMNSLSKSNMQNKEKSNFLISTLKNRALNAVLTKITSHFADRALKSIDKFVCGLFRRKK